MIAGCRRALVQWEDDFDKELDKCLQALPPLSSPVAKAEGGRRPVPKDAAHSAPNP